MRSALQHQLSAVNLFLIAVALGLAGDASAMSLGTWLVIPGEVSTAVSPVLRFDQIALCLLAVIYWESWIADGQREITSSRPRRAAVVLLALVTVITTDLVVVLIAWTLLAFVLQGRQEKGVESSGATSPVILHLSSVFLLAALLMGAARYHTTDLLELIAAAAQDERVDARQVSAGISVLLAGAIAIRCGLFPGSLWLRHWLTSRRQSQFSDVLLAALLPGLALAVRWLAADSTGPDGAVVLAGLAALTVVVAAMIAMAQAELSSTVSVLSIAVAASICVASLSTDAAVVSVMQSAILIQFPLLSVVLTLSDRPVGSAGTQDRRAVFADVTLGAAAFILCSGLAGTNAIANLVGAEAASSGQTTTLGLSRAQLCNGVWLALGFGQCLFGFALVRAICRARMASRNALPLVRIVAAASVTVGVILTACVVPMVSGSPAETRSPVFVEFGPATPAGLLGAVVAWLMFRTGPAAESPSMPGLDSLARMSRNWFYLDAVWMVCVSLPVRCASVVVGAIDRHLISSGREEAWRYSAANLASGLEHVRRAGPVYYGLTVVLVVVGLMVVLR